MLSSLAQSDQKDSEAASRSQSSQTGSGYSSEDTESEASSPSPPIERKNSRGEKYKSQPYKKDSFVLDRAPKEAQYAAGSRLNKAIVQVPDKLRYSRKNRATETLYGGNLNFKATEEDLSEALGLLSDSMVVEKVTIPYMNGKSKYCFIEVSWAQAAMLDIADIMTMYYGVLKVNARPELRDKGNMQ